MQLIEGRLIDDQLTYIETQIAASATKANYYKSYYTGDNYEILAQPAKLTPPDNRVPNAFAGKLIDTMKGYARASGKTTYLTDGDYIKTLKDIFDQNDEELKHGEVYTDALTTGYGYMILRVDEDAKKIKTYVAAPGTCCAVYDDTLEKKMLAFVHYVTIPQYDNVTKYVRTIYYADRWEEYTKTDKDWTLTDGKEHPFGDVPCVEYTACKDKLPMFYRVLSLIKECDKITSSSYADERERYVSAILLALKKIDNVIKDANGNTAADRMRIGRILDDIGSDGDTKDVNAAVGFLAKPSRGPDVAEQADRFERLIYDFSCVVNMNDYKAGTPTAAIAYKLKVMSMEFKAADIDTYFDIGIQRFIMLIGNAVKTLMGIEPEMVTIKHGRNIPTDLDALALTAGNLKGILSDETIVELFPGDIVPDKGAELKRLKEKQEGLPGVDEDVSSVGAAEAGDVQATALNGAQIASLLELATNASTGALPKESAIAIAKAAFPLISDQEIESIFASIVEGGTKPEPVAVQAQAFGKPSAE